MYTQRPSFAPGLKASVERQSNVRTYAYSLNRNDVLTNEDR